MTYYLCCMEISSIPNPTLPKKERYLQLSQSLQGLLENETDFVSNMANAAALIFHAFEFHWVGFYWVKEHQLVLGPFQGPVACSRIHKGKGICGTAWEKAKSIMVPDVSQFPGHIACSALSQSELVIPIFKNNEVIGVMDIDSAYLNDFDEEDVVGMEKLVQIIETTLI